MTRGAQAFRETSRLPAAAVDERGDAVAAEAAQRRPDQDAARAARQLRREVERLARRVHRQIRGIHRHRVAQRRRVAHQHDAALVGDVQPLVRVGGPRVGALDALDLAVQRGTVAAKRPNAPSTCSHEPLRSHHSRSTANGSDAPELTLPACAQTSDGLRERRQRIRADAALRVGREQVHAVAAESDEAERLLHGGVVLLADVDRDRRRTEEPVGLDVPARAREQCVARGGQRAEVRERRAADESAAAARGQAEELREPAHRHFFEERTGRRARVRERVLVPRAREHARGDRRGQRPARHEAEVARARARDGGGRAERIELGEHVACVTARFRQRRFERLAQLRDGVGLGAHGPRGQGVEIGDLHAAPRR